MAIETGGPAFPVQNLPVMDDDGVERRVPHYGLDLRDYFAAKAMQAIIAADGTFEYERRAIEAYQAADAMLEARK